MTRNEILENLRQFIEAHGEKYHIRRIGVFGSAARDAMKDDSDIDIVVVMEPVDFSSFIGLKHDLEEILYHKVDVIRYRDRMNPFFKNTIDHEAVYV